MVRVSVRVPATSANIGPGFDCLGIALNVWNTLTVESAEAFSVNVRGEGESTVAKDESNLIVRATQLVYTSAGLSMPPLKFSCENAIPCGAGLGSSSAAIIAGIVAGYALLGKDISDAEESLLQLAAQLENHVDNIAPCLHGGFRIGLHAGGRWRTSSVNIPTGLKAVVFVPSASAGLGGAGSAGKTEQVRAILTPEVTREDAVFNISRAALLVNAFNTSNWKDMRFATQDALHQPARGQVMPILFPAIEAALASGAAGAFLSGAGPSVLAFIPPGVDTSVVGAAMASAAASVGVTGRLIVTEPTIAGATVTECIPSVAYISTRDGLKTQRTFQQVAMEGLAKDGGLYVPAQIPLLSLETIASWSSLAFVPLAERITRLYIDPSDINDDELRTLLTKSYSTFRRKEVVPLVQMSSDGSLYLLEQFHGPTCAFKDVALQFVGNLFELFLSRSSTARKSITVVGATSGDTGSAAIEGLRGKDGIRVFILHPKGRVAAVQEAQMTTVLDANVHNIALSGTFDDCQAIVKRLFEDSTFRDKHNLAAINSINWARILAQIVYYFHAYNQWITTSGSAFGTPVRFCVPSGNFGNAVACYYARAMGLPVSNIIVATNRNDILHRFFSGGDFTKRSVVPSLAPAMDITIPSNFERFLYHHSGGDSAWLNTAMRVAKDTQGFAMGEATARLGVTALDDADPSFLPRARALFTSSGASDDDIRTVVASIKRDRKYVLCPHTAAGVFGALSGVSGGGPVITMATAHPGKFGDTIDTPVDDDGVPLEPAVPECLKNLLELPTRCMNLPNDVDAVAAFIERTPV